MTNSSWSEIKLEIPHEYGELIAEIFNEEGAGGVVYEEPDILKERLFDDDEYLGKEITENLPGKFALKVYFPVDDRLGERLKRLKIRISDILGKEAVFELKQVQEEDWAAAWKSHLKPEHIGNVVIKPSWVDYTKVDDETIIELDPGMAFGTGTHPTTRLCILFLQEMVQGIKRMADIGTGSGILAVVGAKLGIGEIVAADIDPVAVRVATENVQRNQVENQVTVIESNLLGFKTGEAYDLVIANIITNAIVALIPDLAKVLKSTGKFVASGIIDERFPEVEAALIQNGFVIEKRSSEGGWTALKASVK